MQELIDELNEYDDQDPDTKQAVAGVTAPSRSDQDVPKHPAPGKLSEGLVSELIGSVRRRGVDDRSRPQEASCGVEEWFTKLSKATAVAPPRSLPHDPARRLAGRTA
jgi:hypothetical protein